ncbi:MAG: hypothetical protein K2N35_04195 [Muribaculaceae bacterium]|nr:hypothetical protein [Muribaculaceae bacterium]
MVIKDNENTTLSFDFDDATHIVDHSSSSKENVETEDESITKAPKDSVNRLNRAKTVGGIAAGGILLGSAASLFMDLKGSPTARLPETIEDSETNDISNEGVILPEITVEAVGWVQKSAVDDGMTFEEAFSAAREAMGPGSAFEWRGNIYATYTWEEWTEMSDDQKSDFYATLHIANPFSSSDEIEIVQADVLTEEGASIHASSGQKPEEAIIAQNAVRPEENTNDEDIPIVSVGNISDNENDIQILGVSQDISTGYNVGHLSVDGEEVVVIDVDGDMIFDSMVADLNHDGDITPDEIIDISQNSLSLDDFRGHSDIFNPLTSSGETPDYLSELGE